jgi:hypothetical protein
VVCSPRLKLCSLLEPHLYTPTPVPLLVLDLPMYQIRPALLFGLKPFCHSQFSRKLTMNGLCYTYLSNMLSVHICRIGSCSIPNIYEPLSNSWCQNGDMKQVPYSEHKILELPVNLTLVVLLNVHALIILFFYIKNCNNYADDIRCHHIKYSLPRFVHPATISYRVLYVPLNSFPLHYEAVAVTHS